MVLKRLCYLSIYFLPMVVTGCINTINPQASVKVLSINIRLDTPRDSLNQWLFRKESMVDLLKREQPGIIGLQEALHHQLLYLDSALSNHVSVGVARDDGKTRGEFSSILIDTTNFSIQNQFTFWLSESGDTGSVGWDAAITRVCTAALLSHKSTGKNLWVFNSHFDHMGEMARTQSAHLIINRMKEVNSSGLPVIVMGDFNSIPESDAYSVFAKNLSDGLSISEEKNVDPIGTFNGFDNTHPLSDRIDYIFVKNLSVQSYSHLTDRRPDGLFITDHLPVMAVVGW